MKVKFMPQNVEVEATPDKSLLQIATENNIEIKSICKGIPSCAECRVHILDGEGNILPPGKAELDLIGTSYFIDSRRLSCQVRCYGDVTVDLTEQVDRLANQTKKTRGFRSSKPMESKAIQDTMILNEKPSDKPEPISDAPSQPQQQQPKANQQQRPQEKQGQGGGGRDNRNNRNNRGNQGNQNKNPNPKR